MRIAELLKSTAYNSEVVVKGWVRTKRGNKNVAFIALNDGSCVANIQIVVDLQKIAEEELKLVTTGACICVNGTLVESLGAGQGVEVQANSIEVYGTADPESYPLQKKGHSLEYLWIANAIAWRIRNTAPNVFVRGRKYAMSRRNSSE